MNNRKHNGLRSGARGVVLSLLTIFTVSIWQPAQAAPPRSSGAKTPAKAPQKPPIYYPPGSYEDDVLILVKKKDADQEEIDNAIKEVNGTVIDKLEHDGEVIYKVKTGKDQLIEAEKKLSKDENFKNILRNGTVQYQTTTNQTDPYLAQEWYLNAVRASEARKILQYNNFSLQPIVIAVIDSGSQSTIADLSQGRTLPGFDVLIQGATEAAGNGGGQIDGYNHGTWVATTAAANRRNGVGTAGVAPNAIIYPVRIADKTGKIDQWNMLKGLQHVWGQVYLGHIPIKIVNLSINAAPPNSFANVNGYSSLVSDYAKAMYDKGCIVFNAAGNSGKLDNSPILPHLCVVSAIDSTKRRPSFSVYGAPIWFTCPGVNIYCSGRTGSVAALSGTSLASPICAATAALLWGAKPSLKNSELLSIMTQTCDRSFYGASGGQANFGYGLPNCVAALRLIQPELVPLPPPPVLLTVPSGSISMQSYYKQRYQEELKTYNQLMLSLE